MTALLQENTSRRGRVAGAERLKRLLSDTGNLRRMLLSYRHEPSTERFFNLREALWERINTLEGRCRQLLGGGPKEGHWDGQEAPNAQELYVEYSLLEGDTWRYLRDVRG